MSLGEVLEDLQSDIENISVENISVISKNEAKFKLNTQLLDKKVIEKFNTLYYKLTLKETVKGMNKIDLKIAQEVFTMLPEMDNVEKAKVTSYPSSVNKSVIDKALSDIENTVPQDAVDTVQNLVTEIQLNSECLTEIKETINRVSDVLEREDSRLVKTKPIIIVDGVTKNLYSDKIREFSYIDDSKLDYSKYDGALSNKYHTLVNDKTLKTYMDYNKPQVSEDSVSLNGDFSLSELVQGLIHLKQIINTTIEDLLRYLNTALSFLSNNDKTFNEGSCYVVNELENKIETLKYLQMLHGVIETENNFLEQVETLVKFID